MSETFSQTMIRAIEKRLGDNLGEVASVAMLNINQAEAEIKVQAARIRRDLAGIESSVDENMEIMINSATEDAQRLSNAILARRTNYRFLVAVLGQDGIALAQGGS